MKTSLLCTCLLLFLSLSINLGAQPVSPGVTGDYIRESLDNPLIRMETNFGDIIIELFPSEAPITVDTFLGLAEGTKSFIDPETGESVMRPFYDGLIFHRVIDGFMIQGGSVNGQGNGMPGFTIRDEINASSLGLDRMMVITEDGSPHPFLGINSQDDLRREILRPLYRRLDINSQADLDAKLEQVEQALRSMTLKQAYENQGYRYQENINSRAPTRGVIAMANGGPDTNGSQFFINLVDTEWLTGKHTVFGRVRSGMEVVDEIGRVPVDQDRRPLRDVVILSVTRLP